jgi:hypothetical protein
MTATRLSLNQQQQKKNFGAPSKTLFDGKQQQNMIHVASCRLATRRKSM